MDRQTNKQTNMIDYPIADEGTYKKMSTPRLGVGGGIMKEIVPLTANF